MEKTLPSFEVLKDVSNRLKKANIKHALGGSGLLAHLDLVATVQDWDITTDAELSEVESLFSKEECTLVQPNDLFASKYLLKIKIKNTSIDLIGKFAIKTSNGVFNVPTIVSGEWDGIPLGSPGVWAKAYELMGRAEKAKLLSDYIKKNLF